MTIKTAILALVTGITVSASLQGINLNSEPNYINFNAEHSKQLGLTAQQVLNDIIAEHENVVLYIGASWCPFCVKTVNAIKSVISQYRDVVFVEMNADLYKVLRTMRIIPELRFYKNGVVVKKEDSKTASELKKLLDQFYR